MVGMITFLLESNIRGHSSICKEELEGILETLCQEAEQKSIKILKKDRLDREKLFNEEIIKSLQELQVKKSKKVNCMKWNTPIRSGSSLEALILLKNHRWIF